MNLSILMQLNIIMLAVSIFANSSVAAGQGRSFTDTRDVYDIGIIAGTVWCATGGGLIGFQLEKESFASFTFTEGIEGTKLSRLVVDDDGGIWMAVENRIMQHFSTTNRRITHRVFLKDISAINDIAINDRGIYIALDIGVGRLKYFPEQDDWYWFERFTRLSASQDFPDRIPATAVVLQEDSIWVGTRYGVSRGDLTAPINNMWHNYNTSNGLSGNEVRDLAVLDAKVYAATDGGISMWDGMSWSDINSPGDTKKLEVGNNTLYAVTSNGVFWWNRNYWSMVGAESRSITSAFIDEHGICWAGFLHDNWGEGGIAREEVNDWIKYIPDSPLTNYTTAFTFDKNGDLIMVGGRSGGEYGLNRLINGSWQTWSKPLQIERIFAYPNRSVTVDFRGGIWVGSFGAGIAYFAFHPDGTLDTIRSYDNSVATGQRLIGYRQGNLNYVLAPSLATDKDGNIWVANRGAIDGRVLVCIPREFIQKPDTSAWLYFHRSNFRNFGDLDLVAVDGNGRKWLASTSTSGMGRGVYVFDENGTLEDTLDDQSWGPIPGLSQPEARCLTWDPDGYIWAGTIDGAYYIDASVQNLDTQGFSAFYFARDEQVNAIAVDPAGNKWLGTNHGIMIVGPDLYTVIDRISTDPPNMLPDSVITAISIDPKDGWVYIGTENGGVTMRTPYRDFGESLDRISVAPNPFNPNLNRMYFTDGLANDAKVRIFTPDGRLVRKLSHREAGHGWDGRDETGRRVADGIYLILTYNSQGQAGQSKVAVVWK